MDKPMTFNEWLGTQGNMVLLHANCCRIAYEAGQQSQQAKVEELQVQLKGAEERAQLVLQYKDKYRLERDDLQKQVDAALDQVEYFKSHLDLEQKGFAALILKELEQALKGEG